MSPTAMMVTNINRHYFFTTPFSPEKRKSRTCEELKKNPDPNTDMAVKMVVVSHSEKRNHKTGQTEAVFPVATRCQNRRDAKRKSR